MWRDGQTYLLNDLIPPALHIDIDLVWAISNAGQIAGGARVLNAQGQLTGDYVAVRLTPIPPKPGDMNCDDLVNIDDLVGVITRWNDDGGPADLDHNGTVGIGDLMEVLMHWGN